MSEAASEHMLRTWGRGMGREEASKRDGVLWVTADCRWSSVPDADLVPQDLLLRFQYSNTHTHRL